VERSPWIFAGNARFRARRAGWIFQFDPPAPGTDSIVRGVVEFQWRHKDARKGRRFGTTRRPGTLRRSRPRRKGRRSQHAAVVRERTLLTKTGMKGVQGGDPAGLSKAMCLIW
jgi:hypothetical protein